MGDLLEREGGETMTTPQLTPDILTLLQYLDGELEANEAQRIEQQAITDAEVRSQLERLRQFIAELRTTVDEMSFSASHPPAVSVDCPDLEVIIAYAASALGGPEKSQFEQHLRKCEACLHDVVQHRMVAALAAIGADVPLPVALKAKAEAQWAPPKPALTRLVIQQAKKGLERGLALVERYLVEPVISVLEMPTPQLALRGEASVLVINVETEKASVEGTLIQPANDGLTLTLKLLDADRKPLSKKFVEIREQGKLIFSAETDAQGMLDVSDIELEPGTYEVACPAIQTTFELDVRAPQE